MADHVIKYEYDGCMYANFIVPQNGVKDSLKRQNRLILNYMILNWKYKLFLKCLLHLIFTRNSFETKMHRVDTIDRAYEEKLDEESVKK